jgi:hypothetical protein
LLLCLSVFSNVTLSFHKDPQCIELLDLVKEGERESGMWPRTSVPLFAIARDSVANALLKGTVDGNLISQAILSTIPRLLEDLFHVDCDGDEKDVSPHGKPNSNRIFFFNEQHWFTPPMKCDDGMTSVQHTEASWTIDEDELPWHCLGTKADDVGENDGYEDTQHSFVSVWILLRGSHAFVVADSQDANSGHYIEVDATTPNRCVVIIGSKTPYTHKVIGEEGSELVVFQYTGRELKYGDGPLAFSIPCLARQHAEPKGSEAGSCREPLSLLNGLTVFDDENDPAGVTHDLKFPGDSVLIRGRVYHASRPGEKDRMLLKLVIFFHFPNGNGNDCRRDISGDWLSKRFALEEHLDLIHDAFVEVSQNFDRRSILGKIWAPYNQYRLVNMQKPDLKKIDQDQIQNVRRVTHGDQVHCFLRSTLMRKTAALIEQVESILRVEIDSDLRMYDFHFLRQIGPNAASFCKHQDIHDTGNSITSAIKAGMAVLLGGWHCSC